MKKAETIFTAILVPLDFIALLGAGLTAYFLRFSALTEIRPVFFEIPFDVYFGGVILISLIWLIIFVLVGLYQMRVKKRWIDETIKIILACSTGVMVIIIAVFLSRELFSSRFIILAGWILAMIYTTLIHTTIRFIKNACVRKGLGVYNVILIGQDKVTEEIAATMYRQTNLGYKIIERIKNEEDITQEKLAEIKDKHNGRIDEIIQGDSDLPREVNEDLLDFCNQNHIVFKYAADMFNTQATNIRVETISGVPIIEIKKTPLEGWGRVWKRILDVILSAMALIILLPVFAMVSLIIKIDSTGPVFVGLKRIGEKKKPFVLYKFRSMIINADKMKKDLLDKNERTGPLFKMKDDPRVTGFGKFIRKFSIDELPQFWNVFKGDMSLVGPRPHEPEEVSAYGPNHKRLLDIKPGITGMAQISGRADLDFEDEVRLDTYYIENWSIKLDLYILTKTPLVVFSRKGAK
ncbi:MAG: sugar transferase [Patescibacteria group bacterium]